MSDSNQQGSYQQHEQRQQHCSKFIVNTLKAADHALTYPDFGETYDYGTLRNEMRKLAKDGEVLSPIHEWPKRFILREWAARPEYAAVRRNDKRSTVGRFDFLSYLEGLDWSSTLAVHNLKFSFEAFQFPWLPISWDYCAGNNSWSKSFDLSYAAKVQCFNTGSVVISVRCSARPIPLDLMVF